MKSKRQIRLCWSKKKDGVIDFNAPVYSSRWVDNYSFKTPDENGDEDLEQSFKRSCFYLNEKFPHLNHHVEHRYA